MKLSKTQIEILTTLKDPDLKITYQVYRVWQKQRFFIFRPHLRDIHIREMTFEKLRESGLLQSIKTEYVTSYPSFIYYTISPAGLAALASLEVAR